MNAFFYGILKGINSFVGNWGVAIILFTILIRLLLTPLDMKSRAGMRKMSKLQPQLALLQKKYANDREKLNAKTAELYRKEHVNPLSSCLPLLLTWPILIIIFGAMRSAANDQLLHQMTRLVSGEEPQLERFLWIKNLWMPDSLLKYAYPDAATLKGISSDLWQDWFTELQKSDAWINGTLPESIRSLNLTAANFNSDNLAGTIDKLIEAIKAIEINGDLPYANVYKETQLDIWLIGSVKETFNGLFLLPALSAGSQILMTKISSMGQPKQEPAPGQPNTGKFMQIFFPLLSVYFCLTYTASFALYWVAGNFASLAQTVLINKYLDNKEKKALNMVAGEGTVK